MSAHAIGHVHRPVQTLVDTYIAFRCPPQDEKQCKQIPPSAPYKKALLSARQMWFLSMKSPPSGLMKKGRRCASQWRRFFLTRLKSRLKELPSPLTSAVYSCSSRSRSRASFLPWMRPRAYIRSVAHRRFTQPI